MTIERDLIQKLSRALRVREVWFDRRDDQPPICFDCELQQVQHGGYGWTYQHAPDCRVRLLLQTADDLLKEPT